MAAILNKKISSAGIFFDFSPWYYVVIQATFLKSSAFYIFFQVGITFELMLLDYYFLRRFNLQQVNIHSHNGLPSNKQQGADSI